MKTFLKLFFTFFISTQLANAIDVSSKIINSNSSEMYIELIVPENYTISDADYKITSIDDQGVRVYSTPLKILESEHNKYYVEIDKRSLDVGTYKIQIKMAINYLYFENRWASKLTRPQYAFTALNFNIKDND